MYFIKLKYFCIKSLNSIFKDFLKVFRNHKIILKLFFPIFNANCGAKYNRKNIS